LIDRGRKFNTIRAILESSDGGQVRFQIGQEVFIPCQIQDGAFSSEVLVSITAEEGVLSGFADRNDVRIDPKNPNNGTIRASVVEIDANAVKVRICGSFFTIAAGTTLFSSSWADRHLQAQT
jgi:hypothetical protein